MIVNMSTLSFSTEFISIIWRKIIISVGNKPHVPFYIPFAPQILHKPLFQMLLGVMHFPKSIGKQLIIMQNLGGKQNEFWGIGN